MQIFVKQATPGATLVFSCSETTTLNEFLQWVEDKTAIPEAYYFITYGGHYIAKSTDEQKHTTFAQLGIKKETTLTLNGRLYVKGASKKLSASA